MAADDETAITDIELMPDGRIFVFGTSREVLEVLRELERSGDSLIQSRLVQLNHNQSTAAPSVSVDNP